MQPPRDESTLGRAMDRLLDCVSPTERASILLDAVLEDGLAQAAGLWRRVGGGPVRAWHPLLSRGPASCLPTLAQLEAVARGDLDRELPLRGLVLSPADDQDFALCLGEVEAGAERLAELEGLLSVWAAIERAEQLSSGDLLDSLPGPSPRTEDLDAQIDELEELLGRFMEETGELPTGCDGTDLADVLEYELARRVGVDTEVRWRRETVPPMALDDEQLDDLVENLLDGLCDGARRVRVELTATPPDMPGTLLVIESDTGWPPSLDGSPRPGRPAAGLSLAAAELSALGGSLGLERGSSGGLRLTAWLPALASPGA